VDILKTYTKAVFLFWCCGANFSVVSIVIKTCNSWQCKYQRSFWFKT